MSETTETETTTTPKPPTTREKLEALLAEATNARAFREGIQAILDDLNKPRSRKPDVAAVQLETDMYQIIEAKGPVTLQDVMRALDFDMLDSKPYTAMRRMVAAGKVIKNDGRPFTYTAVVGK